MVYTNNGKEYKQAIGSRALVWHSVAHHTSGGLTKSDLKFNKTTGRIVSKLKSQQAKAIYRNNTNGIRDILKSHQYQ